MMDAPARSVSEAATLSAPEPPAPRWSFARCLGFRFACVYLVLYSFPFPIGMIPGTGPVANAYEKLWIAFLPWLGKNLFQLPAVPIAETGSGDTTFEYLRLLCMVVLAVVLTIVWS